MKNNNLAEPFGYTKTRVVPIGANIFSQNKIVMGLKNDARSDYFRILRTNVLKQLRDNNWNSFLVTSATEGAGKSLISLNLAIAMALEGNQSVLLVDADLRKPGICNHLNLECKSGFIDYLSGIVSLEDIMINPSIENLVIVPGRDAKISFSELISSAKMIEFIQEVKTRYQSRIIIYDIPPLFVADDALLIMPYIDAALFVVEDEKNTTDELEHAMQLLEQINLLGIVLNKARKVNPIYKYGYGY